MLHTVTISHTDGTPAGWIVQCFKWQDENNANPQPIPLVMIKQGDAFVGTMDLDDGIYALECDLRAGVELDVDLTPQSPIFQPPGGSWPVTVTVEPLRTRDIFPFYFRVGGGQ